jgi:hypothetical protein
MDMAGVSWPIHATFGAYHSAGHDDQGPFDIDARTTELALGVKKIFGLTDTLSVFLGGGPALVFGSMDISGFGPTPPPGFNNDRHDSDAGAGIWASTGLLIHPGRSLNLGLQARWSTAKVNLFGEDRDAGGFMGTLMAGARF